MGFSMKRWVGKVAIVTGASSGCGAAAVKRLLEENVIVVGIARRKDRVKALSESKNLHALQADVTKEEELLEAFKWVKKNLGPIHILLNCAGILRLTNYLDGETKFWREMMETNYLGLCIATREAVKDMRANNVDGHIIHINDIGGYKLLGIENTNACCASKYSVTAALEGLRVELCGIKSKIKVSSINPGYVKTEILDACIKVQPEMKEFLENAVAGLEPLSAEDITDMFIFLLSTAPHVQVHELTVRPVGEEL